MMMVLIEAHGKLWEKKSLGARLFGNIGGMVPGFTAEA